MGNYATTTSISEILPGFLKGNTTTTDAFGTSVMARRFNDAEAEINGVIAARYSLPFTTVPPLVRSLTAKLAAGYAIRDGFAVEGLRRNQYLDDFKEAKDTLKMLVTGDMKLTYTDGSLVPVNTSSRFKSSAENYTPIFGRDEPKKWTRDQDEIDDTSNARE